MKDSPRTILAADRPACAVLYAWKEHSGVPSRNSVGWSLALTSSEKGTLIVGPLEPPN
jgi:hypothetical protein